MTSSSCKILLYASTAVVAMAGGAAQARTSVHEAIGAATPIFESSLRAEGVDQEGFAQTAAALTWRNRFGFTTGAFHNVTATVEVDSVVALVEDYNSTLNGRTAYPVVADPQVTEINRAQLAWTSGQGTTVTVGRQRIILDDARFIGHVGWRQDDQTFDAVRLDTAVGGLRVTAAYLSRVNRIFGDEKDWDSNSYVVNASYSFGPALKLTAFHYVLDFETAARTATAADIANARLSSVTTTGLRLQGGGERSGVKWGYVAQHAAQSQSGGNPAADFDLSETFLEGSATWNFATFRINYESLEGNGSQGFVTPLGTVHAFEGWADAFSATGGNKTHPDGIRDLSASLSFAGKTPAWAPWFMNPAVTLVYHDFETERTGMAIGTEFDAMLTAGLTKNLSLTLKYADFQRASPAMPASRAKTWIMLQYKL